MSQTKLESWIESICNNGSAFIISVCVFAFIITPLYDAGTLRNPVLITVIFTVISLIRSFLWRRFFNAGLHRVIHRWFTNVNMLDRYAEMECVVHEVKEIEDAVLAAIEKPILHIVEEIKAERLRQIHVENFSLSQDDRYTDESLAKAAAAYALGPGVKGKKGADPWPRSWYRSWDKRKKFNRRRQLVIAGALLIAEIQRLERAGVQ